jgi:uncharacterized protein (TIGR03437 family)
MKKPVVYLALAASSLWSQTAETIPFRAVMLPSNEVPAININASGAATIWLHVVRDAQGQVVSASTDFNITYQFPGEIRLTGLHIHKGRAGDNGPVTINSGISGEVPSPTGRGVLNFQGQTLSSNATGLDTVNGMLTDPSGFYVNLHTTDNPNGVIRGQLQRAEMVVLMGLMSPANETPPIPGTNASAYGSVVAIATCGDTRLADCARPTSGQVIFDSFYSGFGAGESFSGFHIHDGPAGFMGPVTINTGISGGANAIPVNTGGGTLHYEVEVPVDNAAASSTLAGLFRNPAGYYINIHTLTNPGGIIRAQLRRTDKMQFPVLMTTANEVPPITGLTASAPANFTAYTIRDADGSIAAALAFFDVNYRFPGAATFTGLHIHNGRAGDNGGVTINTGLSGTNAVVTESGQGNIYRIVNVTTAAGLATLNSLAANPEAHYINLHTTINPNGVVRSQLMPATTAVPAVTAVISAVSDPTLRTVAPNGLMTIFGTNFVKTSTDIGSSFNGEKLPTTFNGVQVTIGGIPAPLLIVAPTYIVAQVPQGVTLGNQAIVVKNGNGSSITAVTVPVNRVAPALYFGPDGGVFTKTDYTLVTAASPARVGDLVWAYGTGFGAVGPALNAGDITPGDMVYNTGTVTATVGGRDARVLYSIASPGYAGLYQVLFEVPAGVTSLTGNVPVQVSMGGTIRSNSVNLQVR